MVMDTNSVPELIPLEQYDTNQARLRAGIGWLLSQAFNKDIPQDMKEPFTTDSKGEVKLQAPVISGLISSTIYCQACMRMFPDASLKWHCHMDVIQALSRKGIYVTDPHESAVTDNLLRQDNPFKLSCHLSLTEALMKAYTSECVTIEKVVQAVRKFSSFNASNELPFDTEDSLLFWMNKVCGTVRLQISKGESSLQKDAENLLIPMMDDLMKDISDGCCLATAINFYCPDALKLEDLEMNDSVGIAGSLYNLQCVKEFCQRHLPVKIDHLSVNDLFHASPDLKNYFVVFLAELFSCLEIKKNTIALHIPRQSATPSTHIHDDTSSTKKQLVSLPHTPISNATKRSFQQNLSAYQSDDQPKTGLSAPRQTLLPRRSQQDNSSIDAQNQWQTNKEGRQEFSEQNMVHTSQPVACISSGVPSDSQRQRIYSQPIVQSQLTNVTGIGHSTESGTSLLSNVSIDSDMSMNFSESSIDISEYEKNIDRRMYEGSNGKPKTSAESFVRMDLAPKAVNESNSPHVRLESITPEATIDPENIDSNSKAKSMKSHLLSHKTTINPRNIQASTDALSQQQDLYLHLKTQKMDDPKHSDSLLPVQPHPCKEMMNNHTKQIGSGEKIPTSTPGSQNNKPAGYITAVHATDSSGSSTPDEDYQTPSVESMPLPGELQHNSGLFRLNDHVSSSSNNGVFEMPVTASFTIQDRNYTAESARAAGLPVVEGIQHLQDRGSSDKTDSELKKIQADGLTRETRSSPQLNIPRPESLQVVPSLKQDALLLKNKHKTSFAELKQNNVSEHGCPIPMAQMTESNDPKYSTAKIHMPKKIGPKKKTTFAALPNQTTWQENVQDQEQQNDNYNGEGDLEPSSSELIDIKMRLEERRRQIENEKRKMEMQWTKNRQRLGKQAFIQVINRGKSETDLRNMQDDNAKTIVLSGMSRSSHAALDTNAHFSRQQDSECKKRPSKSSSVPASRESSGDRDQSSKQKHSPVKKSQKYNQSLKAKDKPQEHVESPPKLEQSSLSKGTKSQRKMPAEREDTGRTQTMKSRLVSNKDSFSNEQKSISTSPPQNRELSNSYHAPETSTKDPTKTLSSAVELPSSMQKISQSLPSNENPSQPGSNHSYTSLDRLNSSLSELQGEIMRLSLQQDQIKSLVVPPKSPQSSSPSSVISPSKKDKFYLCSQSTSATHSSPILSHASERVMPTSGGPLRSTSIPHSDDSTAAHLHGNAPTMYQQPTQTSTQQSIQYPTALPQSAYGAMSAHFAAQYPTFIPGNPQHLYTIPQPQFPTVGQSHYQTSAQMYQAQPSMYQHGAFTGVGGNHWPGISGISPIQPQHAMQPTAVNHQSYTSASSEPTPQFAQTYTVSSSHAQPSPITTVPHSLNNFHDVPRTSDSSGIQGSLTYAAQLHTTESPVSCQSPHSPTVIHAPSVSSPGPTSPDPHQSPCDPTVLAVDEPQPNAGFFIVFDEGAKPQKPKPRLGEQKKDNNVNNKRKADYIQSPPKPAPSSPLGFIIGDEEESLEQAVISDMEKKKEKLLQLQMKRREEAELNRQKKEDEMSKKRQQQMQKLEEAEQKRAEEKLRREAIFQEYLKRKAEDSPEEDPKTGPSNNPVPRRMQGKSKPRASRPKSQPPASSSDVAHIPKNMHGSQEDLHMSGASPPSDLSNKYTGHMMVFPAECGAPEDQTDSGYQQLAFGGLTHRRPPTPDRQMKPFNENFNDNNPIPASQLFTGPKLFKKPSQKSNRNIISNAISHCCLAGEVNTPVKSKVLEGMTASPAKHFLVLFRDGGQQYKGLYTYDPEKEEVLKIHGLGPKQLTADMFERFYKYNSGAKSFTEISSTKHLSATIDAVVISNSLWQKKMPSNRRPPNQY